MTKCQNVVLNSNRIRKLVNSQARKRDRSEQVSNLLSTFVHIHGDIREIPIDGEIVITVNSTTLNSMLSTRWFENMSNLLTLNHEVLYYTVERRVQIAYRWGRVSNTILTEIFARLRTLFMINSTKYEDSLNEILMIKY